MRVAISVGHDARSQGAFSLALDMHEHQWNGLFADALVPELESRGAVVKRFERPSGLGYQTAMAALTSEINDWGPDLVVELHFNAMDDPSWAGCCVLHWPSSTRGNIAAAAISEAAAEAIGNRNRGAVAQDKSWNAGRPPLYLLRDTKAPATIVESFFGSSSTDSIAADKARKSGALPEAVAQAIVDVIASW